MENVYYNPEKYGLTPVGEIDFSDGCYQFDITAVWRDSSGGLHMADDRGCSCPAPFEDTEPQPTTVPELQAHLLQRMDTDAQHGERERIGAEIVDLMARVV